MAEKLSAFDIKSFDSKRVSTSAIANVLGGAQVRMAVDSAVTQERVLAAIRDAASSLDDQIDDSQVEKLQVGLAGRISSSPDDTKLLEEAKCLVSTALDESQSNKQEHMILEAIRLATRHHPLSVKESNEVVVRVTKAMAEGAALDIAVLDALPKNVKYRSAAPAAKGRSAGLRPAGVAAIGSVEPGVVAGSCPAPPGDCYISLIGPSYCINVSSRNNFESND